MGAALPVIKALVPVVITAIGAVGDWMRGTKEINQAPAYNPETATIDETAKMNDLLSKKRSEFRASCNKIESTLDQVSTEIFGKLISQIDTLKERGIHINTGYIEQKLREYSRRLDGGIAEVVNRRLALSDSECASILKQESGDSRSQNIDRFVKKIIQQGFETFITEFESTMNDAFEYVHEISMGKIKDKEAQEQSVLTEVQAMNKELTKEEFQGMHDKYTNQLTVLDAFLEGV